MQENQVFSQPGIGSKHYYVSIKARDDALLLNIYPPLTPPHPYQNDGTSTLEAWFTLEFYVPFVWDSERSMGPIL